MHAHFFFSLSGWMPFGAVGGPLDCGLTGPVKEGATAALPERYLFLDRIPTPVTFE